MDLKNKMIPINSSEKWNLAFPSFSLKKQTHKLCGLKLLEGQPFLEGFSVSLSMNNKVLIVFFWNKWKVSHWFKCRSCKSKKNIFMQETKEKLLNSLNV